MNLEDSESSSGSSQESSERGRSRGKLILQQVAAKLPLTTAVPERLDHPLQAWLSDTKSSGHFDGRGFRNRMDARTEDGILKP
jgi:hypothetical protein